MVGRGFFAGFLFATAIAHADSALLKFPLVLKDTSPLLGPELSRIDDIFLVYQHHLEKAHVHEAAEWRVRLLGKCAAEEITDAERAVCAVAFAQDSNRISFSQARNAKLAIEFLEKAQASIDRSLRLVAEGRVYGSLPPVWGLDVGKALLALEQLKHTEHVELATALQARIFALQGNISKADSLLKDFNERPTDVLRRPTYGWVPSLVGNSGQGLGLRIEVFDDRIFDSPRGISVEGILRTSGLTGIATTFKEESLSPVLISLRGYIEDGTKLYYRSLNSQAEGENILKAGVELFGEYQLESTLKAKLGGRFDSAKGNDKPYAFQLAGPFVGLEYSTLDLPRYPLDGMRLAFEYFPAIRRLENNSILHSVKLEGDWIVPLERRYHLGLHAMVIAQEGEAHPLEMVVLEENFSGLVPRRFNDKQAVGLSISNRYRFIPALSILARISAASTAPRFHEWQAENTGVGFGFGLAYHHSAARIPVTRLEFAWMASLWAFRVQTSAEF